MLADEELRTGPLHARFPLTVDVHDTAVVEGDDIETEQSNALTRRSTDELVGVSCSNRYSDRAGAAYGTDQIITPTAPPISSAATTNGS